MRPAPRPLRQGQTECSPDEQWNEIFKFGGEQAEPVAYARETPTRILPLWLAALVVACGIVIGGVKGRSFMRRQLRTHNSAPDEGSNLVSVRAGDGGVHHE